MPIHARINLGIKLSLTLTMPTNWSTSKTYATVMKLDTSAFAVLILSHIANFARLDTMRRI